VASTELRDTLVRADPDETEDMENLRRQIDELFRMHKTAQLIGPNGERTEIPESAFHALQLVVEGMSRGLTMTLVPHGHELTTQEAAEILHVSRPHLTKLLKDGVIPFHQVGTHRRVRIEDVLAYREQRAGRRREKLDELTRQSQELGAYS
jgi:excisionase family DNA binding protein